MTSFLKVCGRLPSCNLWLIILTGTVHYVRGEMERELIIIDLGTIYTMEQTCLSIFRWA